jgi:hypothetical protein
MKVHCQAGVGGMKSRMHWFSAGVNGMAKSLPLDWQNFLASLKVFLVLESQY